MIEEGRDQIIHHKFLIPVHIHMEADTVHDNIEIQKKYTMIDIELPRDWSILISLVSRKTPINVIQLEHHIFLNFKKLIGKVFIHKNM